MHAGSCDEIRNEMGKGQGSFTKRASTPPSKIKLKAI
jgi:hypothetical protein